MTLISVERMKLFSTRSPWWCIATALVLTIGFAAMFASQMQEMVPMSVGMTQQGAQFGLIVVMVMATLAVTTEYRFGTIRATFQAMPNRVAVMLAKTSVVAVLAFLIGELAAFGSWAAGWLLTSDQALVLDTATEWRQVAGVGLVFAGAAIFALSVGALVRQTAGAVTLVMIWVLLAESLIQLLPTIGDDIYEWLPFAAAFRFMRGGGGSTVGQPVSEMPIGPWASLVYFLAIAVVLLVVALVTVRKRDA
ncbi:hypothetical protein [Actinopolyspora saharensis]|uniref:ABC-2 type transport system permease protein n=1 Tax=Actinopolyspora saharensis TaxID=995062 RepID=A0A1H1G2M9_9ACTN|nr:hypothetical protein [Actinopolyspora saharensis]SDR07431.1 ABC-2 type transport system permease protein [Actinopolyspora saharensis]